jgi:Domain of unknown function (DUF3425)
MSGEHQKRRIEKLEQLAKASPPSANASVSTPYPAEANDGLRDLPAEANAGILDLADDPGAFFQEICQVPDDNTSNNEDASIVTYGSRPFSQFSQANVAPTPAVNLFTFSSSSSSPSASSSRPNLPALHPFISDFADERLIVLTTLRPQHGYVANGRMITSVLPNFRGYLPPYIDDEVSPISMLPSNIPSTKSVIPANLWPTTIQCTVPHHPWIDILPWPNMRDKLITLVSEFFDVDDCDECFLLHDIQVWGSCPELAGNWEIGETFAQKYWFLLDKEIIGNTNWWRAQRQLPPLSLKSSLYYPSTSQSSGPST